MFEQTSLVRIKLLHDDCGCTTCTFVSGKGCLHGATYLCGCMRVHISLYWHCTYSPAASVSVTSSVVLWLRWKGSWEQPGSSFPKASQCSKLTLEQRLSQCWDAYGKPNPTVMVTVWQLEARWKVEDRIHLLHKKPSKIQNILLQSTLLTKY